MENWVWGFTEDLNYVNQNYVRTKNYVNINSKNEKLESQGFIVKHTRLQIRAEFVFFFHTTQSMKLISKLNSFVKFPSTKLINLKQKECTNKKNISFIDGPLKLWLKYIKLF